MITLKQFINFARMVQYQFAMEHSVVLSSLPSFRIEHADKNTPIDKLYQGLFCLTPYIVCKDGSGISVQTHHGAHCKFKDIPTKGPFTTYSESCNLEPVMVETNSPDLDQYGIDCIETVEEWIDSHGGIDIDKSIEYIYNTIRK